GPVELAVAGSCLPEAGQDRRGPAVAGQGDRLVGRSGRSNADRTPRPGVHLDGIAPPQLARSPRTATGGRGTACVVAVSSRGKSGSRPSRTRTYRPSRCSSATLGTGSECTPDAVSRV